MRIETFGLEIPTVADVEQVTASVIDEGASDLVARLKTHNLHSSNRRDFNDCDYRVETEFGKASL